MRFLVLYFHCQGEQGSGVPSIVSRIRTRPIAVNPADLEVPEVVAAVHTNTTVDRLLYAEADHRLSAFQSCMGAAFNEALEALTRGQELLLESCKESLRKPCFHNDKGKGTLAAGSQQRTTAVVVAAAVCRVLGCLHPANLGSSPGVASSVKWNPLMLFGHWHCSCGFHCASRRLCML